MAVRFNVFVMVQRIARDLPRLCRPQDLTDASEAWEASTYIGSHSTWCSWKLPRYASIYQHRGRQTSKLMPNYQQFTWSGTEANSV